MKLKCFYLINMWQREKMCNCSSFHIFRFLSVVYHETNGSKFENDSYFHCKNMTNIFLIASKLRNMLIVLQHASGCNYKSDWMSYYKLHECSHWCVCHFKLMICTMCSLYASLRTPFILLSMELNKTAK